MTDDVWAGPNVDEIASLVQVGPGEPVPLHGRPGRVSHLVGRKAPGAPGADR